MKKILIVEDVDLNIELLTQLLEDDYTLAIAKDGEQGVVLAGKMQPDLILMDVQIPVLDGYEVTRRLKADPVLRAIPIIAVTSYALSGDESKARAAGCNGYVSKPYSTRQLLAKIREYVP